MFTYPAKLDIYILNRAFVYIHILYMRAAKALVSMRICIDSPEPSVLADVISIEKSRALVQLCVLQADIYIPVC